MIACLDRLKAPKTKILALLAVARSTDSRSDEFRVRVHLVFVGIRYKHLGYEASKPSPSYNYRAETAPGLPIPAAVRRRHPSPRTPIPDMLCSLLHQSPEDQLSTD